jgi:hypothetical protein
MMEERHLKEETPRTAAREYGAAGTGFEPCSKHVGRRTVHDRAEVCPPGSVIRIELDGWLSRVPLLGRVVWSRRVPPHLYPAFGGGMGVRLQSPGTWSI